MHHDIQRKELKRLRKGVLRDFFRNETGKERGKSKPGWQVALWKVSGSSFEHITTKAGKVVRRSASCELKQLLSVTNSQAV